MAQSTAFRRVGVIGLGIMGSGMAGSLLRAGYGVTVYNRTAERSHALAERGAEVAPSPAALASACDAVVSVVSDVPALEAVMLGPEGVLAGARPGTLLIDATTVVPETSREMARRAAAAGCTFLDAPVLGSKDAARDGQLLFLVGGEREAFERARPLFAAMGRQALWIGPSGAGSTLKLINNMMAAVSLAALSEAMLVAESAGLSHEVVAGYFAESIVASPFLRGKLGKLQQRDFSTQFALELMHKDLRYFAHLSGSLDQPTPVAALVGELFRAAKRAGYGRLDMSALFEYLRQGGPPAHH